MSLSKLPPIEKLPEALSVLADERIVMKEGEAKILSSNHEKTYTVRFSEDVYASNDAATYWQGYPGYPILAVWMKQGILPFDKALLPYFKHIDWHERNKRHKRNYAAAYEELLQECQQAGADIAWIDAQIKAIYHTLNSLSYTIQKNTKRVMKHTQ